MHCRSTKQRRAAIRRSQRVWLSPWMRCEAKEKLAFRASMEQFLASVRKNYRVYVDEARFIPPDLHLPEQYQVKVYQGSQVWPEQSKIAMCSDLEVALICDSDKGVKTVPFEEIRQAEVTNAALLKG